MKRFETRFGTVASLLGLVLFSGLALSAQDADTDPPQQPHPEMRAARLSFVSGDVQLAQGSQIIADPALVNTPLFEGSVVTTRENGQAELQFDDGSIARLSPNSSLQIAVLRKEGDAQRTEVLLTGGLGYFEAAGSSSNQMITRFGDVKVKTEGFTVLRVNLDNPPGELAVFTGSAHLERTGPSQHLSLQLHGGQSVALNESDPNQYNLAETIEPDSWDAWNADRDQDLVSLEAAKTPATSSQPNGNNPAWGDLDTSGNWYNVPGQGYVWSPYQAADSNWDPYGCGNWVYTPQFGYIWVSCESWGYMPYTSGYWNYYDGFGWGWTPGYGYPWWFTGGWGWNIGHRPARYDPPHRPRHGPARPVEPIHRGGSYQPNPVIAVNRNPSIPVASPVRVIGRSATIGGSVVQPIKPLSPRLGYNHIGESTSGRAALGSTGSAVGGRSGYNPWANSPGSPRPANGTMPAPGTYRSPASGGSYRAPVASPYSGGSYRGPATSPYAGAGGTFRPTPPSSPSGGYRPSAAPAPTPRAGGGMAPPRVSGGGGGGASRPAPSAHK